MKRCDLEAPDLEWLFNLLSYDDSTNSDNPVAMALNIDAPDNLGAEHFPRGAGPGADKMLRRENSILLEGGEEVPVDLFIYGMQRFKVSPSSSDSIKQ